MLQIKRFLFFLIFFISFSCGGNGKKKSCNSDVSVLDKNAVVTELSPSDLPVIDLNKKYPVKRIVFQDIADIEYIPLETRSDILIGGSNLAYFSDRVFITFNIAQGDIYIFDSKTGKLKTKFNRKGRGGSEYIQIHSVAYDEKAGELYIVSAYKDDILVYSEDGHYLRSLILQKGIRILHLYNYDANLLIGYNNFGSESDMADINQRNPYLFISKRDGRIMSRIETNYRDRISAYQRVDIAKILGVFTASPLNNMLKSSEELIIADVACDTIFSYTDSKGMTPLFIRSPSVWSEPAIDVHIGMKTDRLLSIVAVTIDPDAMKAALAKATSERIAVEFDTIYLMFDMKSGEVFTPEIFNSHSTLGFADYHIKKTDIAAKNTSVSMINSYQLVESLRKGELNSGPLKEIAEEIGEDDNPVLMVVRFK
jgi:hypothetical protein